MAKKFLNGLVITSGVTSPDASGITLIGAKNDKDPVISYIRPGGEIIGLAPALLKQWQAWALPNGDASAVISVLCTTAAAVGTATLIGLAATTFHTRKPGIDYLVTVAAVGAIAGVRGSGNTMLVGGAAAGQGGFHFEQIWGPATGVATSTIRGFSGISSVISAPVDAALSTFTNLIGMGCDSADTNWQIIHAGAAAPTKIDLGASFPRSNVDRTDLYHFSLYSPPGTTQRVDYRVVNLKTGAVASGSITTNLPLTTVGLGWRSWMSSGATSAVIGYKFCGCSYQINN